MTVDSDGAVTVDVNCGHRLVCSIAHCNYVYQKTPLGVILEGGAQLGVPDSCIDHPERKLVAEGQCVWCKGKRPSRPAGESLPIPEGFERVQVLVPELGKLLWDKGFIFLGAAIPYELLTDPEKIKENGSPLYIDLLQPILYMENFSGLGVAGAARLKVALFMHVIGTLQEEILQDVKTAQVLDSMKVKNWDRN